MNESVMARLGELGSLCAKHRVRRLDLFGSGIGRRFDPASSDLDFLVEFQAMPPTEHADRYFGLLADLEDLLQRPIDLIESSAIRNPYFRQAVDETRIPVYAAA
jgi:predicted nucleotidyltransferase